jgi:hypothetical protein
MVTSTLLDNQLINCGGLGACSSFFYYDMARESVPDGSGSWAPPIRQLDVTSGMIGELYGTAPAIGKIKDSLCTSTPP